MICLFLRMLSAQPSPFPNQEEKPKAATASLLPPLPRVKGTIVAPPANPDGKVQALNAEVFTIYQNIKKANPGALTLKEALALREAIIKDDQIDAVEADLLAEMTNSMFRSITITQAGTAESPPTLTLYPCSGNAKDVLRETLFPKLDLEKSWAGGLAGWREIILESQKDDNKKLRVMDFIQSRITDAWAASNQSNGFKPLRDLLGQRYGYSKAATMTVEHAVIARKLMIDSCRNVDKKSGDQIPDYMYTWWQ